MGRLLREEDVLEGLDYGIKIISDKNIGYNYMRLLGATREMVKNLPTAFNVEVVIEEMKNHPNAFRELGWNRDYFAVEDAIEVVRRGGVK